MDKTPLSKIILRKRLRPTCTVVQQMSTQLFWLDVGSLYSVFTLKAFPSTDGYDDAETPFRK